MRTTLEINDEILEVARILAARRKQSIGRVIPDMARRGLQFRSTVDAARRNGVRIIERRADSQPVTLETVNNPAGRSVRWFE